MKSCRKTSARVAAAASRVLRRTSSGKTCKTVAGSALSQRAPQRKNR